MLNLISKLQVTPIDSYHKLAAAAAAAAAYLAQPSDICLHCESEKQDT